MSILRTNLELFLSVLDVDFDIKFFSVTTKLIYYDGTSISIPRGRKSHMTRVANVHAARKLRDFSSRDLGREGTSPRWEFSNIFSSRSKLIPRARRSLSETCFASRCARGKRGYEIWTAEFRLTLSTRSSQISLLVGGEWKGGHRIQI